jgi:exodeoxyribonuclease VII small subunit
MSGETRGAPGRVAAGADRGEPVATGYAAALAELEQILAELERADVDVDRLATQVQRAAALIGFCRERIGNARLQIEQVVAGLADDTS